MPRIMGGLPPEMEVREFADQSLFVRAAINGVIKEGVIAASLTAVMSARTAGAATATAEARTRMALS